MSREDSSRAHPDPEGLILAGGYSRRMGGQPKALAKLGGQTLLERLVASFRTAGVHRLTVVTGHESTRIESVCQALGVQTVHNPAYAQGMFSSVQAGLRAIDSAALPDKSGAVLITPVDAALVLPRTIRSLVRQWTQDRQERDAERLLIPSFLGKGGHPLLLPAPHRSAVLDWAGTVENEGLRGYMRALPATDLARVPVPDAGLLCDLDTPDDLLRAEEFLAATHGRSAPTLHEAWQAVLSADLPEETVAHSRLVALNAHRVWRCLTMDSACPAASLPPTLPLCAGLLHDIARSSPDHARKGGEIVRAFGWDAAAVIVESHMDFPPAFFPLLGIQGAGPAIPAPGPSLAMPAVAGESVPPPVALAAACVYLADKYAAGATLTPPFARFAAKRERWRDDPAALAAITLRETCARLLDTHIAALSGAALEEIMRTPSGDAAERQLMTYITAHP